MIIKYSITP